MKCSNCGSNIPDSAKFCGVCGTAVQVKASAENAQTVAFDPSADPEFQNAAAAFEAGSNTPAESKSAAPAQRAESQNEVKSSPATKSGAASHSKTSQEGEAAADATGDESDRKKGKFRETIWFMQADDPEMMSAIENEKLEDREATYQDPGGSIDERSREKFSLNMSESKLAQALEREALGLDGDPESSKGWFYASVAFAGIVVLAGIYFIFVK